MHNHTSSVFVSVMWALNVDVYPCTGPMENFLFQTNKNSFGLSPANQVVQIPALPPGDHGHAVVTLNCDANKLTQGPPNNTLQVSFGGYVPWLWEEYLLWNLGQAHH